MGGVGDIVNDITGRGTAQGTAGLRGSTRDVTKQYNQLLEQIKGLYAPGREMAAKGFNPGDLTQDPGYKFAQEQGLNATQNAAGVQGSPFGGAAMAEMQKFSTGLASQTYNQAFDRWNSQIGNLTQMAGLQSGNMADLLKSLAGVSSSNAQTAAQTQASQSDMF